MKYPVNSPHVCLVLAALSASNLIHADDTSSNQQQLDTIVVTKTASRDPMPLERVGASVTILTSEDIEERGYTRIDDLLDNTVGITSTNTGGSGKVSNIMIRGEDGFRTKIFIDGIDVSNSTATQIQPAIENISLADIERIEILRGPQGMMYGADAGGVINIITKKASKPFSADLSTEYGRYNTRNTSGDVRGQSGVFDYSLALSRQDTNGFNTETADTVLRDNDGYGNTTANGSVGMKINDQLSARYIIRNVDSSNDYDGCSFPASYNCKNSYLQHSQRLELTQNTNQFTNEFAYSESSIDTAFFSDGIKGTFYKGDTKQAQYFGTYTVNTADKVVYGVDYTENKLTDTSDTSVGKTSRNQTGVYSEWQGAIGKQFFYTLGDRNDDSSDFGSHNSYRTTAAWLEPLGNNELKYKASYGTGFRAPSLYEIATNNGPYAFPPASQTTLKPETSKGFDAGVEFHATSGLSLEAVYFDQQIENAIDYDLVNWSGYLQTSGTTHSKGVELSGNMPVTKIISVFGNYTYNDTSDETGQQRLRRPRNHGGAGTRIVIEKFSALVNWRFANDAVDVGQVPLSNYHVVDATLGYAVTPALDIYTRAQNIFNEKYQVVNGYNTEGAAVYAGFRARY
jgi:vitamin B12 transporter